MGNHYHDSAWILALADAPRSRVARALRGDDEQGMQLCKETNAAERAYGDLASPYGKVIQEFELDAHSGPPIKIQYAHPQALLWVLIKNVPWFAWFLATHLSDGACRTLHYSDDIRPGNALRPDDGRMFYGFYMQLLDLPEFFRWGVLGWMDLLYVTQTVANTVVGGIGAVASKFWQVAKFPFTLHIPPGVRRPPGVDAYTFTWGGMNMDGKAISQCTGWSGASSYHACPKCENVIGRLRPEDIPPGSGLVHYSCTDSTQFVEHTQASMQHAVDKVRDAHGESKPRGEAEEILQGIKYNDGTNLLFQPNAIARYDLPRSIFVDPLHVYWASGGVGQYECNQFLNATRRHGVPLQQTEKFLRLVHVPGERRFRMTLSKRMKKAPTACLKAFAAEVTSLIPRLLLFAEHVLVPQGVMMEEVDCMRLLHTVMCVLKSGDRAADKADKVDDFIRRHHKKNPPVLQKVPKAEGTFCTPHSSGHEADREKRCVLERRTAPSRTQTDGGVRLQEPLHHLSAHVPCAYGAQRGKAGGVLLRAPRSVEEPPLAVYRAPASSRAAAISPRPRCANACRHLQGWRLRALAWWLCAALGCWSVEGGCLGPAGWGRRVHVCGRGHVCARGRSVLSRHLGL